MTTEIKVPALGESVTEATVARWLKKAGDAVKQDEPLVELETDKVTLEVNAPVPACWSRSCSPRAPRSRSARCWARSTPPGRRRKPAAARAEAPKHAAAPRRRPRPPRSPPRPRRAQDHRRPGPRRRRRSPRPARTGASPRATCSTTLEAKPAPAPVPARAAPAAAAAPRRARARARSACACRACASASPSASRKAQNTAAMLTTFNEVDMGRGHGAARALPDAFEKKHGVKLGFMSFFVKACDRGAEGDPGGQRRDRRRRDHLQELLRHRRRGRRPIRAWSCRWCATPTRCPSPRSRRRSAIRQARARRQAVASMR
jgi:2-oxoglutarate dehydrogenase E2 component (dihydrolipoamide succinyltransferase)